MAQLQTLSLAFGDKETSAIEVSRSRINTLVSAIATNKTGTSIGITKDSDGNSLLSGYVKPAEGETMLESNKYVLEKNNINVVGEVKREKYTLNMGGVSAIREGDSTQIYCQNEDGVNVSMQSMVVWVYADFARVSKSSDLYNDSDIQNQFNVLRGESDNGWTNLGSGLWRARINDSMGMLKLAAPTSNYSWTLPCYIRAYPASIDDNPSTTDTEREARLCDALDFVAQAVAVSDASIKCSKVSNLQAGDIVVFSVDQLLPANNTKAAFVPNYSVLFTASEGSFDGSTYVVPNTDMFNISALITYMGMQISVIRSFMIDKVVITNASNAYVFGVVKTALGLPNDTTGITNRQCANATAEQIVSILTAFSSATANFSFEEGRYFTCEDVIDTLGSVKILRCSSFSLGVSFLKNCPNFFNSNHILTVASFPNLESLDFSGYISNMFYLCDALKFVSMPKLKTINGSGASNMFSGCAVLEDYDFSSLQRIVMGTNNAMFSGCKKLTKIVFPSLEHLEYGGSDSMFMNIGSDLSTEEVVVTLPKLKTLKTYVGSTFSRGNIRTLSLPSLETIISSSTSSFFANANLRILSLPILRTISISVGNLNDTSFNASNLTELNLPMLETYTSGNFYAFQSCGASVIKMDKLISITCANASPFYGNRNLTSLSMKSLEMFNQTGNSLFRPFCGCTNLSSVDLPSLKYIAYSPTSSGNPGAYYANVMFSGCTSLEHVSLPSVERVLGVQAQTEGMFSGCTVLKSVVLGSNSANSSVGIGNLFKDDVSLASESNEIDWSLFPITDIEDSAKNAFSGALNVKKVTFPSTFRSQSITASSGMLCGSAIRILDMRKCNRTNITNLGVIFASSFSTKDSSLCFARLSQRTVPLINESYSFGRDSGERYPIFVPKSSFSAFASASGWSAYYDEAGYQSLASAYNASQDCPWKIDGATWAANLNSGDLVFLYGNDVELRPRERTICATDETNAKYYTLSHTGSGYTLNSVAMYLRGDGTFFENSNSSSEQYKERITYIEGDLSNFTISRMAYDGTKYYLCIRDVGTNLEWVTTLQPSCYWSFDEENKFVVNNSPKNASYKYLYYKPSSNGPWQLSTSGQGTLPLSIVNFYAAYFAYEDHKTIKQTVTLTQINAAKAQANRLFPDTWMRWMCKGYMFGVDGEALSYDTINEWINAEKGTVGIEYDLEDMSGNLIYEKLG